MRDKNAAGFVVDYTVLKTRTATDKISFATNYVINFKTWLSTTAENKKRINFEIGPRSNTDKITVDAYLLKRDGTEIYLNPANTFVGISYQTDNNQNKMLEPFVPNSRDNAIEKILMANFRGEKTIRDQFYLPNDAFFDNDFQTYNEGSNVNAFDLNEVDYTSFTTFLNRKKRNNFIYPAERLYSFNSPNPIVAELRKRSIGYSGGTALMFAKVKPDDPQDTNYYFITNEHVVRANRQAAIN